MVLDEIAYVGSASCFDGAALECDLFEKCAKVDAHSQRPQTGNPPFSPTRISCFVALRPSSVFSRFAHDCIYS
ncbi:hypothetical protein RB195_001733 [Necator americanus]|uniref:Uncharacterized protein n=1 Tax=Necator americanus TaxID=51031 RepID=A0ABR1DFQ0_NECAM